MPVVTQADEIKTHCGLTEDATDPRWAGSPKHVFRGSHYHFGRFGHEWDFFDEMLGPARIWDKQETEAHPERWYYVEAWSTRYRAVWVCPAQRATFVYCEGDLALVTCETPESYAEELADAARCYGRHEDFTEYQKDGD